MNARTRFPSMERAFRNTSEVLIPGPSVIRLGKLSGFKQVSNSEMGTCVFRNRRLQCCSKTPCGFRWKCNIVAGSLTNCLLPAGAPSLWDSSTSCISAVSRQHGVQQSSASQGIFLSLGPECRVGVRGIHAAASLPELPLEGGSQVPSLSQLPSGCPGLRAGACSCPVGCTCPWIQIATAKGSPQQWMKNIFHFQLCVRLMEILQLAQADVVRTVYLLVWTGTW